MGGTTSRTLLEAELVAARSIYFVPMFASGRDCWRIESQDVLQGNGALAGMLCDDNDDNNHAFQQFAGG